MRVDTSQPLLHDYLAQNGINDLAPFEVEQAEWNSTLAEAARQHPEESESQLYARAGFRLAWKYFGALTDNKDTGGEQQGAAGSAARSLAWIFQLLRHAAKKELPAAIESLVTVQRENATALQQQLQQRAEQQAEQIHEVAAGIVIALGSAKEAEQGALERLTAAVLEGNELSRAAMERSCKSNNQLAAGVKEGLENLRQSARLESIRVCVNTNQQAIELRALVSHLVKKLLWGIGLAAGAVILAIILATVFSLRAHAQLDGLRIENSGGTTIKQWAGGIAKIRCSTNLTCTLTSGRVDIEASGAAGSAWDTITNPTTANTALSHGAFTTTFTWNAATGASNLFRLTDTLNNTGTGILFSVDTASGSGVKPVRFTALGTANGVEMSTAGSLGAIGTGGIVATTGDSATAFFGAGAMEAARGGTGLDSSGSTGVPRIAAGTWTADAAINHLASSTSANLFGVLSDEFGAEGVAIRCTLTSPAAGDILSLSDADSCVNAVSGIPVNAQTGASYTVVTGDRGKLVTHSNAGAIAVTLPQAGGAGFANDFFYYTKNLGAGAVTITPTTSTIDGGATLVLSQNECAIIFSNNTNYFSFNTLRCTGTDPAGSGDSIEIEDGDNAGTFTAISATAQFDDSGDINFAVAADVVTATVRANSVALTTDTTGDYVASFSAGAGISGAASGEGSTPTLATASGEADFLISGALTCGLATQGKMQVHTTPLQYCDNAATPALQYAAYGNSTGEATSVASLAVGDGDIADGAVDGGTNGEIADGSITPADVSAALDNHIRTISIISPTTSHTNLVRVKFANAITITRVSCDTTTATSTATIQLDERAEGTPNTAGTDVMTSTLVCDTDNQATTTFSNATIAADAPLNLQITATANTPTVVNINIEYTID